MQLIENHKSLLIYLACSVTTACVEFALGWLLLQLFPNWIVPVNTCAIIVSAALHYLLTTRFAFGMRNNYKSLFVYVVTFFVGLVLQNLVIWLCYDVLCVELEPFLRYAVSKVLSLGIPFFVLYYLRRELNKRIAQKDASTILVDDTVGIDDERN